MLKISTTDGPTSRAAVSSVALKSAIVAAALAGACAPARDGAVTTTIARPAVLIARVDIRPLSCRGSEVDRYSVRWSRRVRSLTRRGSVSVLHSVAVRHERRETFLQFTELDGLREVHLIARFHDPTSILGAGERGQGDAGVRLT